MAVLAGGLRARMIFDNLYGLVETGLADLGWFGSDRRHQPIHLADSQQDITTEIPINTLSVCDENIASIPWEIGSQLTEDTRYYYLDFFGESDSVGKHIMGDVRDILLGKLASIGRTAPVLYVYDLRQATPPQLFSCDIVHVRQDRAHNWDHPWLKHWYSIQMGLLDYFTNDQDAGPVEDG